MPSATILPYPPARRRDLVRRQANWFASQPASAAERNLGHQLTVQRDTLLKKGVAPERVAEEVRALEGAIRAEVWRTILTPEGAA